ncbi:conserved hypothetical protein [Hyella patelloides LEGE 07179]|uniref:Uncharacterized protein n=1 Tax=Hyella patelloides LEGE 07179 TaxID=945734 RepID=A0A563VN35_9CYAN|nr:hypothetical protein [Hyella patelloides]VEP12777.1 conserved hypothetical protein [Hyella patelloides LEGE 07179]
MQLAQVDNSRKNSYLGFTKSFLLWSFTLTVCFLVVGFPIGVLLVTCGILATIILQAVLPSSAVVLVTGSILSLNLLIVVLGAAILTFKGIHPEEVSWLHWLHGKEDLQPSNSPVYAACPLTCNLTKVVV